MEADQEYVALPLVSVSEAAKYLGVGKKVIYQLIEWGELKVVRVDGTVQVEKRSLDEFRESGKLA